MSSNALAADLDHILLHTRDLWGEVKGKKIFLTGGTGFFGCWLLESFAWANDQLNLGAEMVVLTRNPNAFAKKAPHLANRNDIRFYKGDVRVFEYPPEEFSHVIHAATDASAKLNAENPQVMFDTVVEGTRRVLDFAAHCRVKKFLLASSGAVYGRQPPDLTHVPEDYNGGPDLSDPGSAYGEGKRAAELLCVLHSRAFRYETKIARGYAFVGPHLPLDTHFAIGNFIRDAMAGGPIAIGGDGTPYRSYLYAADLAIWLWTIFFRGPNGRAYNVGSQNALTIAETAAAVSRNAEKNVAVTIAKKPVPGQPAQRYVPSVARAEKELQLKEWIPLEEGIRRTIGWHQCQNKINKSI